MAHQMQWTNALSTHPSLETAIDQVVEGIQQTLSASPHLGILFVSSAYTSDYPRLLPLLLDKYPIPVLVGCGGGGIIGMNDQAQVQEIEENPALSLTVAHLPNVDIHPFYLTDENLPDLDSSPQRWIEAVGVSPDKNPQFILLSEPFSSPINDLIEGLDFAYPNAIKVGGLASSAAMGVSSALFAHTPTEKQSRLYRNGTVGVALSGDIIVETIVAQGCRPIGHPYQITQGERNIVVAVTESESGASANALPPVEALRQLLSTLSEKDQQLAQNSLFIGIARDEFALKLNPGDFLIRNLLGVDPRSGAIAIGDRVRPGQRLQFHLRDAQTSADDLQLLLEAYQQSHLHSSQPQAGLMFSCLGRGQGLYGMPNFDSGLFNHYFPHIPLSGFFCNGEIGPVGGRTFLHGYTSAFALFRQLE